jgi:hypothetical protein
MDLDYTRALYPPGGEHLGKEPTGRGKFRIPATRGLKATEDHESYGEAIGNEKTKTKAATAKDLI